MIIGIKILLTTNPAPSSTCTGVLPISSAIALILSTTSFGVLIPAITSTSFITGAGLKKCIPIIGRSSPAPISVIDKEDVFVAKIASSLQISCNSLNVCFLISMFSIAASTIKSQSVQISFTPVVIFAKIASAAACSIFPLATRFSKPFAILAIPFAANSSLISHKHTSYPSVCANACAIPLPIVPAPITPTFIIIPPVKLFYYIIFRSAADTADWKYIKLHYYLFWKGTTFNFLDLSFSKKLPIPAFSSTTIA